MKRRFLEFGAVRKSGKSNLQNFGEALCCLKEQSVKGFKMKGLTEHLEKAKERVLNKGKISFDIDDDEECLEAVKKDGMQIEFIKNPSEEVKLAAVGESGYAVKFIKNPSEEVQVAAVQRSYFSVVMIRPVCEKAQLAAIKESAEALQLIDKPTEKVIIEAVKKDKEAIKFVDIDSLTEETKELLVYLV